MHSEVDVVIVGAGAAGLSAAKELGRRGLSHAVVEASHRIGGRAYSEEIAPGAWFDLGCSFLHHGAGNPFVPVAEALGVELNHARAETLSHIRGVRDGRPLTGEDAARFERYFDACDEAIAASVARGEDRAVSEFADMESEFFLPYANLMATMNSVDIDETSAADYAGFKDDDPSLRRDIPVPGGFGSLVAAWGADVDVALNCRVERIDWSGPGAAVETARGVLRGRAALVTVSTGILAAGDILFDPVLPDWKAEAYRGLPTGAMNKIALHFDSDIFGPDGRGFHTTWRDAGDVGLLEADVNGNNIAILYVGGRQGAWLEKQGQQACRDFALDRVAEVFGSGIRKHAGRSIATAWSTEPWTRGSYSCALPGQAHQRRELARPVDGRLFFAGEATIPGAHATCHGAYLSGIRAAEEIAAHLGPR